MKKFAACFAWIVLSVGPAFAGGGSSIGNGAGIAEQNFSFAYQSLPKSIAHCLVMPSCGLRPDEAKTLREIADLVQVLLDNQKPEAPTLQFVSEKEKPGFFDTAPGQYHRIAKTELVRGAPVFINVDQLYTPAGQSALDLAAMSAILVHEFGHQAGYADHAMLDRLGAHVRVALTGHLLAYEFQGGGLDSQVTVVNYGDQGLPVDLFVTNAGVVHDLSALLVGTGVVCSDPVFPRPVSWTLDNGHWDRPTSMTMLPFRGWLTLMCPTRAGTLRREQLDVEVKIEFQLKDRKPVYDTATLWCGPSIRPKL